MYQESSDGKEYSDGRKWNVKKSVAEKESKEFEQHNKVIGGYRIVNNNANKSHKGTDEVKSFGYDRDKLFGSGYHSTGHLKDL